MPRAVRWPCAHANHMPQHVGSAPAGGHNTLPLPSLSPSPLPSPPPSLPPSLLSRFLLCSITLGQFLSLCLCGTGVTSELLEGKYDISVPTTQAFLNYVLLAMTFGVYLATKKKFLVILKYNWWKYLLLGAMDVEANYLFILAYKYTNMTSIQVRGAPPPHSVLLSLFLLFSSLLLSFLSPPFLHPPPLLPLSLSP